MSINSTFFQEANQYEWRTRLLKAILDLLQPTEENFINEESSSRPVTGLENGTNRSTNSYEMNMMPAEVSD